MRRNPVASDRSDMVVAENMEARLLLAVTPMPVDEAGWSVLTPSPDSRVVYVSSTEGSDVNDGLSAATPKATIAAGRALLRDGQPDWLLLRKGDQWYENIDLNLSGRGFDEPMVVSSYGESPARPRLLVDGDTSGFIGDSASHVAVTGLDLYGFRSDPNSPDFLDVNAMTPTVNVAANDTLVEDVRFHFVQTLGRGDAAPKYDAVIRRCIFADSYSTVSHHQGIQTHYLNGLLIEENIFLRSGWNTDAGARATIFNHAMYIQYTCTDVTVRGNIIYHPSSHGLQLRPGGSVEDNLFVDNPLPFFVGNSIEAHFSPSIARGNVVLGEETIDGAPRGMAIGLHSHDVLAENNIVAHSKGPATNSTSYTASSSRTSSTSGGALYDNVPIEILMRGNIAYDWPKRLLRVSGDWWETLDVRNNLFDSGGSYSSTVVAHGPSFDPAIESFQGNTYHSASPADEWFSVDGGSMDIEEWRTVTGETDASAEAPAFADPSRDIESYMAGLGMPATRQAFIDALFEQSRDNWNPNLTAGAVNQYIREGFAIVGESNAEPVVEANAGATLGSGQGVVLTSNHLRTTDADGSADSLIYILDEAPAHGTLRLDGAALMKRMTFTQADIDAGRLAVEHDGGAGTADGFAFRVTDGRGGITGAQTFDITIGSPADPGTYAVTNSAPQIAAGQLFHIAEDAVHDTLLGTLDVADPDTPAGQQLAYAIEGYQSSDLFRINRFNGDLRLQLIDGVTSGVLDHEAGAQRVLTVTVRDDATNPLIDTETITVIVDDVNEAPTIQDASFHLPDTVPVGTTVGTISADDPDEGQEPVFSIVGGNEAGLFVIDAHTGELRTAGQLGYQIQPQYGLTVRATDAIDPGLYSEAKAMVGLLAAPRVAVNSGLVVAPNASATISADLLEATDLDSTPQELVYTLTAAPTQGTLERLGDGVLTAGESFTQQDIADNRLVYHAPAAGSEAFTFRVADAAGLQTPETTFALSLTPGGADNLAPWLSTHEPIVVAEGGSRVILTAALQATDSDGAPEATVFTLTAAPTRGTLRRAGIGLAASDTFTQADIDAHHLTYHHTEAGSYEPDAFRFTLADAAGGSLGERTSRVSVARDIVVDGDFSAPHSAFPSTGAEASQGLADEGWSHPGGHQWEKSADGEFVYSDGGGAGGLSQIVADNARTFGRRGIRFDARIVNAYGDPNVAEIYVWGVDGPFWISRWNTSGPAADGRHDLLAVVSADSATGEWATFREDDVDFGDGYQYVVFMLWSKDVTPSEGDVLEADNVIMYVPAAPGDFNADGVTDAVDIDAISAALATGDDDARFDLDGDGLVSPADRDLLITGAAYLDTWIGDADLNGTVTDGDYTIWADHYGQPQTGWSRGDFNGDGSVTDADYTLWADHYGAGS